MIKPQNNQILIKLIKKESYKSPSGLLYIPQTGPTNTNLAIIQAVNPTCKNLMVGDTVLIDNYGGTEITNPDNPKEKFVLQNQEDILCIIMEL